PVVFSPHLLSPSAAFDGRPQVRERVFILAEHISDGGTLVTQRLIENRPVDGWDPREWSLEQFLERDDEIPDLSSYQLRSVELAWLTAWEEFVRMIEDDPLP